MKDQEKEMRKNETRVRIQRKRQTKEERKNQGKTKKREKKAKYSANGSDTKLWQEGIFFPFFRIKFFACQTFPLGPLWVKAE